MKNEDLKIEKGIPIPKTNMSRPHVQRGANIKLLKELRPISHSVFFEDASVDQIYNRFYNVAKRNNMKIIVRKVKGGVRLWREI